MIIGISIIDEQIRFKIISKYNDILSLAYMILSGFIGYDLDNSYPFLVSNDIYDDDGDTIELKIIPKPGTSNENTNGNDSGTSSLDVKNNVGTNKNIFYIIINKI